MTSLICTVWAAKAPFHDFAWHCWHQAKQPRSLRKHETWQAGAESGQCDAVHDPVRFLFCSPGAILPAYAPHTT
jgi:hypothetical protein